MPNGRTAIVTDLGNLFTVRIDPTWRYRNLWTSPIGPKLSVVFFDFEDGISEASGVNYADTDVIGRAEQIKTYMGTSSREVPLVFKFRAQGVLGSDAGSRIGGTTLSALSAPTVVNGDGVQARDQNDGLADALNREVINPAKFLDALKYPLQTEAGISVGPPRLILTIGQLLTMRCIATAVQLDWKAPFDPDTLLPYGAEVAVTFTSVVERVTTYEFDGPSRWTGAQTQLVGVDGPANPFSNLGGGNSGAGNPGSSNQA